MIRFFIGADPDLDSCAVAMIERVNDEPVFHGSNIFRAKPRASRAFYGGSEIAVEAMIDALPWSGAEVIQNETIAVVEGQVHYPLGKATANPNDLIRLAAVSGALQVLLNTISLRTYRVLPRDWKGQQKKPINQRRTYERLGWKVKKEFKSHVVPELPEGHAAALWRSPDWKHLGDALGIALWAFDQQMQIERLNSPTAIV